MRIRFHRTVQPSQEVGSALNRPSCRVEPAVCGFKSTREQILRSAVVVHVELGSSDALYIRGAGGPLRDDVGQRLNCIEPGTWMWSTGALSDRFEFQLLLNDQVWERGQPHVLERGHTIHIAPDFEWPDIPKVSAAVSRSQAA